MAFSMKQHCLIVIIIIAMTIYSSQSCRKCFESVRLSKFDVHNYFFQTYISNRSGFNVLRHNRKIYYFPIGQSFDTISNDDNNISQKAKEVAINLIKFYRGVMSPLMPPNCRFVPTCSAYAIESINTFGLTKGLILTAWRIIRCNPTGGFGYDPPQWPPVQYKNKLPPTNIF